MCLSAALSGALARSAFALTAITTISWAPGCSGGTVGKVCFFLNTSFLATSGEAIQRCKGAPGVCLLRGVRRMPWQVRCTPSVPGPGLPGTPLSGFFSFSPKSHKRYGELWCSLLPCLNSVQVCSRTACSSELPHLLPPCGARCATVPMNLVLA